jgi:hypothetical protein
MTAIGKPGSDVEGGRRLLAYEKPALQFVEVHGDQVLALGCKSGIDASASSGLAVGCTLRNCSGTDADS